MRATVFVPLLRSWEAYRFVDAAVIARDAHLARGGHLQVLAGAGRRPAIMLSKLNTLCQLAFILVCMGSQHFSMAACLLMARRGGIRDRSRGAATERGRYFGFTAVIIGSEIPASGIARTGGSEAA